MSRRHRNGRNKGPAQASAGKVAAGRVYEMQVQDLGSEGEGVGRIGGLAVFVPGALPGETVLVRVIERRPRYARGEIVEIVAPSGECERVIPLCSYYDECGGCQLQHLSYPDQLRYKRNVVVQALKRIGHINDPRVAPVRGMQRPWGYRNKAQFPVGKTEGHVVLGFFKEKSHEIVPILQCRVQAEVANNIIEVTRLLLEKYGFPPYDESTGSGLVRHVLVRTTRDQSQAMLVLVVNGEVPPEALEFADELRQRLPQVKSVHANINTSRGNVILGDQTLHLSGEQAITETVMGLEFLISPLSFFQVNTEQAELLYNIVLELARLQDDQYVVDAYCGVGTIACIIARFAAWVHGIEAVPQAVEDARRNAQRNGIINVSFTVGKVEELLGRNEDSPTRLGLVVLDPPRKGLAPEVVETLARARIPRIIYVSCNPATLARDIRQLVLAGYKLGQVIPVDMFPHTKHIECVAELAIEG